MPVTKSAIRKQRRDVSKTLENDYFRAQLRDTLRSVRKKKATLSVAYSVIDKSQKRGLIHPNKAARLKSQIISTLGVPKKTTTTKKASAKTASTRKKTTSKKSS